MTAAVRAVRGVDLPAPGPWVIDPGHAEVAFVGRHFMLTRVRGRFTRLHGVVEVGEDPRDSSVEVTIDMASVDSGSADRDKHLRSAELFDVERFPEATFRSTAIAWDGPRAQVRGELTIKGTTRPVILEVDYLGTVQDPWGNDRAIFSASAVINREDWGVSWNLPLASGGLVASRDIRIEIEVETVRSPVSTPGTE